MRYPEVRVHLVGTDGNAYALLAAVGKAMREAGIPQVVLDDFYKRATAGDYSQMMATVQQWVVVL